MKRLICREQNSIKPRSKNKTPPEANAKSHCTDLLSKGFRISITTVNLSPKLGTKILQWCSYGMTLKKEHQLSTRLLPFLCSTANCSKPT